jgi:hypothetical protein
MAFIKPSLPTHLMEDGSGCGASKGDLRDFPARRAKVSADNYFPGAKETPEVPYDAA